ncbi:MAG TPA: hypothetical protein VFF22_02690 [Pseudomonas sp.]|nr:hypothetical protein [Pseudomonas sp.]
MTFALRASIVLSLALGCAAGQAKPLVVCTEAPPVSAVSRDVEGFTLSPMGSNNYAKVKRH